MARITTANVLESTKQTELFNIVNAIRNSASPYFQDMVGLADAKNVVEIGQAINMNNQLQNEFITSLVNRIGKVVIQNVVLTNPLSRFKTGTMDLGDTIEEIFVDLTREHIYDAEVAETEVFKREIPNVHVLYHKLNRKGFYKQTIQQKSLQAAFTSWDKFGSFLANVIQAVYNSAAVDEYKYMKLLLANHYSKNHFKVVALPGNYSNEDLLKKVREYSLSMTMGIGSRKYNSIGVHTSTDINDLVVLMTPGVSADINVGVLANTFNLSKAEVMGQTIMLDDLGENPETGEKIVMMLVDKRFFMVQDNTFELASQWNGQGLYWNYWLHVWQIMSASRFANAVAFVAGDNIAPITEVVISPAILETKDGQKKTLEALVRVADGVDVPEYSVTWTAMDALTMTPVDGVLTPNPANDKQVTLQTSIANPDNLIIQATVSYGDEETPTTVFGRSHVTVVR